MCGKGDESLNNCSYVITRDSPVFQEIYICHDCRNGQQDGGLLCLCAACANQCHQDHEGLEYVGMGPSYCDCSQLEGGCCIQETSQAHADRLKVMPLASSASSTPEKDNCTTDVYQIQSFPAERIAFEAEQLVQHSKETFWIDADAPRLCALEQVAVRIMRQHVETYNLENVVGCEWWVQVKDVVRNADEHLLDATGDSEHAVDLHYDKDEVLAESFQIGRFPALSTVTYAQGNAAAPPTIVLSRQYDDPENQVIETMFVSRPVVGKHLVFDGRLLHGAPAHYALRGSCDDAETSSRRTTFLVNLWTHHKPVGVKTLDATIQNLLIEGYGENLDEFGWKVEPTTDLVLSDESVLPESHRGRIEIPFTGAGTTWGNEEDTSSVIVSFPPHPELDNVCIRFTNGLQAYQEFLNEDEDDEERFVGAHLPEVYV